MSEAPIWNDLTMVMMTGNRPRMFRSAIAQYAATAPGLRILVADYGSAENQAQSAEVAREFASTVRHYPFPSDTPWTDRFRFLIERCETRFVVQAADDDFVIPAGLNEATRFMRQHDDYAACHGLNYQVSMTDRPGTLQIDIDCGFVGRTHESDNVVTRLLSLMYWYQGIFYSVQRLENLQQLMVPPAIRSGAVHELYTACATAIAGKIGRIRSPFLIRNHEYSGPQSSAASVHSLSHFSDVTMLGGELFLDEYLPARTSLVELLHRYDENRNWSRVIDIAFAAHIRHNWMETRVWSALADAGDISRDDAAALLAPSTEAMRFTIPTDYLSQYITPLAATGWPKIG